MTEVRNKICKGCIYHTVKFNADFDGRVKDYCKKNQSGRDNCKEFKCWGVR